MSFDLGDHDAHGECAFEIDQLEAENKRLKLAISYMNSILSENGVRESLSCYSLLAAYDEIVSKL